MAQAGPNQTSIKLWGHMRAWRENHRASPRGVQNCVFRFHLGQRVTEDMHGHSKKATSRSGNLFVLYADSVAFLSSPHHSSPCSRMLPSPQGSLSPLKEKQISGDQPVIMFSGWWHLAAILWIPQGPASRDFLLFQGGLFRLS